MSLLGLCEPLTFRPFVSGTRNDLLVLASPDMGHIAPIVSAVLLIRSRRRTKDSRSTSPIESKSKIIDVGLRWSVIGNCAQCYRHLSQEHRER